MESTVVQTKQEKFKLLNQKLNKLLKDKNCDPTKFDIKQPKQPSIQAPLKPAHEDKPQNPPKEGQKTKPINKKEKKVNNTVRKAAGLVWIDKSMEEWAEEDYRIFCGNLGNEVTDEILGNVFRNRYASFQKARVVRDKRTGKTRGYGFVSFKKPKDFLAALKEMDGQYVGNRPVKITKSNWKDRDLNSEKNKFLPSDFKTNSKKETNKINIDFKYTSPF